MKIQIRKGTLADHSTEAAVVTLFEGETALDGEAALLDQRSGGQIREIIRMGDFTGRVNQTAAALYPRGSSGQTDSRRGPGEEARFFAGSAAGDFRQGRAADPLPEYQRSFPHP